MANMHADGPTTLDLPKKELESGGSSITIDPKFAVGELKVTHNADGSVRLKIGGR